MKMIVGLGNPGKIYENTRHNIGFKILDIIADKYKLKFDKNKFNAEYAIFYIDGIKYILLKPTTYMNLSGEAVKKFYDYFNIKLEDLLIIYDDLDTKVANFKLKSKGSSGGHNGIKSIISHLGTQNFNRLKLGIDKPQKYISISDYVLGKFTKDEIIEFEKVYNKCVNCVEDFSKLTFSELMNKYN